MKFSGQTVEEATNKALAQLNVTRDAVRITVVDPGKRGFLGFLKKPATIDVTVVNQPQPARKTAHEASAPAPGPKQTPVRPAKTSAPAPATTASKTTKKRGTELDPAEIKRRQEINHKRRVEVADRVATYVTDVVAGMGIAATSATTVKHKQLTIRLEAEDSGRLIGRHGRTVNALQALAQNYMDRVTKRKMAVVVDVGDYRKKRASTLKSIATRAADTAIATGQPQRLGAMPAMERKVIHHALAKRKTVSTHSVGREPYRGVIVAPVKNKFLP